RLDRAALVLAQAGFDLRRPHRAARTPFEDFDLDAESSCRITPIERKSTAFQDQYLVALGQDVSQRRLPPPMSVGDVDVGGPRGTKQPAEISEQAVGKHHQ